MDSSNYSIIENKYGRIMVPSVPVDEAIIAKLVSNKFAGLYANYTFGCTLCDASTLKFANIQFLKLVQNCLVSNLNLVQNTNLIYLSINRQIGSPLNLSKFNQLESLNIQDSKDLSGLHGLHNIETIQLRNARQSSLNDLDCVKLQSLHISFSHSLSLDFLGGSPNLQKLDLVHCNRIITLTPICGLTNLRSLSLESCKGLLDFKAIGSLSNLEELDLSGCGRIENIEFLKNCVKLRKLIMIGDVNIADGDLSVLNGLPNLSERIIRRRQHYFGD